MRRFEYSVPLKPERDGVFTVTFPTYRKQSGTAKIGRMPSIRRQIVWSNP
jgi:hypothetical protein